MSDLKGVPRRVILTAPGWAYPTTLINYADLIVEDGMVVKDRHGMTRGATAEDLASCKTLTPTEAKVAIDAAAWRGETPAEGTRRAIVLEAIRKGDVLSDAEALEIADTVELALLSSAEEADAGVGEQRQAPHSEGDLVVAVGGLTDVPDGLVGEIKRIWLQGGVWLANVKWRGGDCAMSLGIDVTCLKRAKTDPERGEESPAGPVGVRGPTAVITEPKMANEIGKSAAQVDRERAAAEHKDLEDLKAFCVAMRKSHERLRDSDPHYAEYHRGAEQTYALIVERLGGESAAVVTGQAWPEGSRERRQLYTDGPLRKGTPPAEGTRRALIRDVVLDFYIKANPGTEGIKEEIAPLCLQIADAIEEALIQTEGVQIKHPTLSQVDAELAKYRQQVDAIGEALDRLDAPQGATFVERIDRLYRECREKVEIADVRHRIDKGRLVDFDRVHSLLDNWGILRHEAEDSEVTRSLHERVSSLIERLRRTEEDLDTEQHRVAPAVAESKVPSGTRDLRVVLEDVTEVGKPPEYRFIEIDNQDGASVSFPMVNSSTGSLKEIVIPYARDDAWVSEVAYQVAGAATRPLLEDHPSYVFPAERVRDAVAGLLSDFGIPRACADCADCAEEEIGHGAKETALTAAVAASDRSPGRAELAEQALAALSDRIEGGRCNTEGLIEIARLV